MLGERKIACPKKSNNQCFFLQEGAAFASSRQMTINDSQYMSSQSPHQYVWYSENYYCRACWQDVWLVSTRGHVCGLKVNYNQFVTYISSSSASFIYCLFSFLSPDSLITQHLLLSFTPPVSPERSTVLPSWLRWKILLQEEAVELKPLKYSLTYGWEA